tara:strand:+ start:11170 stop:11472 length:303 start_codon:yes stop_codon:yes gene_type:complete
MTDFKEVKDIEDEWEFMLNNHTNSEISVQGGWLQAAMKQIWEFINNVQSSKNDLAVELMEIADELAKAEMVIVELEDHVEALQELLTKAELNKEINSDES